MTLAKLDAADRAIIEKDAGNSFYRKKLFDKALECYDKAIELDATNATFFTNKAAVYFEQGEHDKCREICLKAIEIGRMNNAEIALIAKAYGRIGNSFMKQKRFSDAKKFFEKSLSENMSKDIQEKLSQCEGEIKELERIAYINPELAQEENSKGEQEYEAGNFDIALDHYTEAIKRNPDDAKTYLSRALVYLKLKLCDKAVNDCDESIKKDSSFRKGYIYKGAALESLHEYDKAMDAYQKALEIDPNAREVTEAYYRCLDKDYKYRNSLNSIHSRVKQNSELCKITADLGLTSGSNVRSSDSDSISLSSTNNIDVTKLQKLIDYGLINVS